MFADKLPCSQAVFILAAALSKKSIDRMDGLCFSKTLNIGPREFIFLVKKGELGATGGKCCCFASAADGEPADAAISFFSFAAVLFCPSLLFRWPAP